MNHYIDREPDKTYTAEEIFDLYVKQGGNTDTESIDREIVIEAVKKNLGTELDFLFWSVVSEKWLAFAKK